MDAIFYLICNPNSSFVNCLNNVLMSSFFPPVRDLIQEHALHLVVMFLVFLNLS